MIEVCLVYDVDNIGHDILSQTPKHSGIINNYHFSLFNQKNISDLPKEADALIVLNSPITDINISVPKELTFLVSQEAPNERYKWHTNSFKYFSEVYTQWSIRKNNIIPSHGFLTWYIEKDYDELQQINMDEKLNGNSLAYIGNKEAILSGQVKRNKFVEDLKHAFRDHSSISVDLLGRSYNAPISNKFEVLNKYKYALAIENTIVDHYWTEKISDIFLAGCLPFYIGPMNIFNYFPKDSIITLDYDIDKAVRIIEKAIENNEFEKRKGYIVEARNKVLTDYNLFYAFSEIINKKRAELPNLKKEQLYFPRNYWNKKQSLWQRIKNKITH